MFGTVALSSQVERDMACSWGRRSRWAPVILIFDEPTHVRRWPATSSRARPIGQRPFVANLIGRVWFAATTLYPRPPLVPNDPRTVERSSVQIPA